MGPKQISIGYCRHVEWDIVTYCASPMYLHTLRHVQPTCTCSQETDDVFLVKTVTLPYRNWLHW